MRTGRSFLLAIAATLSVSGCRAWNPGPLAPAATTPRPLAENAFDVDRFVDEHNRNADLIQSLAAKPTMSVVGNGRAIARRVDGRLAMERPRNFKLVMLGPMHVVKADIGSNDDEFWFWVNTDDAKLYWCKYEEIDSSPLAVTYQPDWIIAALGLKPITPEEAAGIKVSDGETPGTSNLVFPPTKSGGATYTRTVIVWNKNRRIKEHRIYEGTTTPRTSSPRRR